MEKTASIYVAGGTSFIGSAIARELEKQGYSRVSKDDHPRNAAELDAFFARVAPEYMFIAAGKISGIGGNQKFPADLMLDNLMVSSQLIDGAHRHRVKKLVYLGSSCMYPRISPQPMPVEALETGPMEPTSASYSLAKLAGLKLCQAYRKQYGDNFVGVIPANPFGPGDHFDLENAHVIGALIDKMYNATKIGAQSIEIWGTGKPRRDFIFIEDLANACVFVMNEYDGAAPLNLGNNSDVSISELAVLIKEVVGYEGALDYNLSKPDGAPLKLLDSSPLHALGWKPRTQLRDALAATYRWFLESQTLESQTHVSESSSHR